MAKIANWFAKQQGEIVRKVVNGERVHLGTYGGSVWAVLEEKAVSLVAIPEELFFVDRAKCTPNLGAGIIKDNLGGDDEYRKPARVYRENVTGEEMRVFEDGETRVYVRESLLKRFPKDSSITVSSPLKPVRVYQGEILIGLVCPSRVKEG